MIAPPKYSVLIVDDDYAILQVFKRIFERKGYQVTLAQEGKDAKQKLSTAHFDVALIDLCLPDMEGTELFPYIEKSSTDTLKIVLTGKTYLQDTVHGADAFIAKPIDPARLLSIIDTKIKHRNLEP
ncbi:MAG: response regulator [Candidatus Bathyarchaeota archaeon]|nr:response regulator [Candidatus Bathyarchaeota archaeon]